VGTALLVEYYNALPRARRSDAPEAFGRRMEKALAKFQKQVGERYTEGTLQRLLESPSARARRAATLALGMIGTMDSNAALAARLKDNDAQVRQMAGEALWSVWFRAADEADAQELQRLVRLDDGDEALAGLNALIKRAPDFAEAYNQRAVVYFRKQEYARAIADCERVLERNPCHFGALSGMAECYVNLRKPRAALKAYRQAFRINPNLGGVLETIRALEEALGEEGKK